MILRLIKSMIPKPIFRILQTPYHYTLALLSAIFYRFPSKKLYVIGVTGTKGKSSVIELVNCIFEEAGLSTALLSTIRFKIGDEYERNLFKMTMPGRFFLQGFLRKAVSRGCQYAIIEMTSEGVRQFRHKFIDLDALIFTNLSPEHIEAHGSFEKYAAAKLKLASALEQSKKQKRVVIANSDDTYGAAFLETAVETKLPFSLKDAEPHNARDNGVALTVEDVYITSPLHGVFNIYNILAAITFARHIGIRMDTVKSAIEKLRVIHGRVEHVDGGQPFSVVVDYAHTPDSLEQLYQAFPDRDKICVLGNTGGGRDTWKRPKMGGIADQYCKSIILTNEDPYDEDPEKIVEEMKRGIKKHKALIIMDRRKAIREALKRADKGSIVLITGKGTDPFIMKARGAKELWSDSSVVRDELKFLFGEKEKQ